MKKHTKLFYRAIARIKAIEARDGAVFIDRLKTKLGMGYLRAIRLKEELVKAGILREWNDNDFKVSSKGKGNIIWKNLSKYRVPKEITLKESNRVKVERTKGLI